MKDTEPSKYDTKGTYKWHILRQGKGNKMDLPKCGEMVLWTNGVEVFEDKITYFKGKYVLIYNTKYTFEECIAWMEYPRPPKKIY